MAVPLIAMAYQRKDALRLLRAQAPKIAVHVALLLLYPDDVSSRHWQGELAAFLKKCQGYVSLKSGDTLDEATLHDVLYDAPLGSERQQLILLNECIAHMSEATPLGSLQQVRSTYDGLYKLVLGTSVVNADAVRAVFI